MARVAYAILLATTPVADSSGAQPTTILIAVEEESMQVRVSTDRNTSGGDDLNRRIEAEVENALRRFDDRITRVEVYLSDQSSSAKSGGDDKRCVMEARLAGLAPVTVTDNSASLEQAYLGAVVKLQQTLERTIERRDNPRRRTSFGGDQTI